MQIKRPIFAVFTPLLWILIGILFLPKEVETPALIITKGMSHADQIASLSKISYFPYPLFLFLHLRTIQCGEYPLPQKVNSLEIAKIVWGRKYRLCKMVIPEGSSAYQIKCILEKSTNLVGEVPEITEGSIVASTYLYAAGSSRKYLIDFMVRKSEKIKDSIWLKGSIWPNKTQWVTFASILEKEGLGYEDKVKIAGVLLNRLNRKMPLQVDATLLYAKTDGKYDARITMDELVKKKFSNELEYKNPYNTYMLRGLPPGPISSPGIETLTIAVNPIRNEYLYYRLIGNKHIFSKTFKEHTALGKRNRKIL